MNKINSVIDAAKGWLGATEYGEYHKEIIECYNKARWSDAYKMTLADPWCAAFVVACFQRAGCADLIPCYAACDQMISIFKKWNRWYPRSSYSPKRGDIIFYEWNGDTVSDHVGIITQNSFGDLSVIEGNKSDTVGYRNISINSANILGVGRPNYDGESGSDSTVWTNITEKHPYQDLTGVDKQEVGNLPLLYKSSKGIYVKSVQAFLVVYDDAKIDIDGEFGSMTDRAVREYQQKNDLEVDGYVGRDTWASFLLHK